MSEVIVHLHNISKKYGQHVALESVSLDMEYGKIYGLIGENGAGKSTLIRIINGLTKPTSGHVSLFGATDQRSIRRFRSRIGYMPDTNVSYPNLNARDNLIVRCIEWEIPQRGTVDNLLQLIGLANTGRKRVSSFSMGMRRRLDFGIALLGNPELLILDEPTNGLDPMGIVEVRKLLLNLNKRSGKTILVSSHNLEVLHKLVTNFAFISHGHLLRTMTTAELSAECQKDLVLRVDEPDHALAVLRQSSGSFLAEKIDNGLLRLANYREESVDIFNILASASIKVNEFFVEQQSLEDYYARLVTSQGDNQ